jgi:hypothetical protein
MLNQRKSGIAAMDLCMCMLMGPARATLERRMR